MTKRFAAFVTLWILMVGAGLIQAQHAPDWKRIGPSAGWVRTLIPDRNDPNLWFVLTGNDRTAGNWYRSTDAARTWRPMNVPAGKLFVHPITSEIQVVESSYPHKLWRSFDHGVTFQHQSLPTVEVIAVDPKNPNILYGGDYTNDGGPPTASYDGGIRWKPLGRVPVHLPPYYHRRCRVAGENFYESMFVAPFDPQTIYLSGDIMVSCYHDDAYIPHEWVSHDAGKTWKFLDNSLYLYEADPLYPDRAYAYSFNYHSRQGRIKLITQKGVHTVSKNAVRQLISVPGKQDELLALPADPASRTLLRSTDAGVTFQETAERPRYPVSLLATLAGSGGVLAGSYGAGVWRLDPEQRWSEDNRGIEEGDVRRLFSIPGAPLFAVVRSSYPVYNASFLYQTALAGASWQNSAMPFEAQSMAINPHDPTNMVAGEYDNVWATTDSGRSWHRASQFYGSAVAFHPSNPDVVYAVDANSGGFYKSRDKGLSFEDTGVLIEPDKIIKMLIDPKAPSVFYFLSDYHGVYKSIEEGKNAHRSTRGLPPGRQFVDMAPLAGSNGYLLLTRYVIYRTLDGAASWQEFARTPSAFLWPTRIFPTDATGQHLFLLDARHFWETTDGGKTWRNIVDVLTKGKDLTLSDATDPRYRPLFLATDRGVYRLEDR